MFNDNGVKISAFFLLKYLRVPIFCRYFANAFGTQTGVGERVFFGFLATFFLFFFELNFFSKKNNEKKLRKILVAQKFALPLHSLSGRNDSDSETQTILDNIPYRQSSTTCLCCLAINNEV